MVSHILVVVRNDDKEFEPVVVVAHGWSNLSFFIYSLVKNLNISDITNESIEAHYNRYARNHVLSDKHTALELFKKAMELTKDYYTIYHYNEIGVCCPL